MTASDIPVDLEFVDPADTDPTYRICLFATWGTGKSVAAASAPTPIVVLSADRPSSYSYARVHHGHSATDLREVRYKGAQTLEQVYRYIKAGNDVRTLVIDPVTNIVDALLDEFPQVRDRDGSMSPDYQGVNRKLLSFLKSLRAFDIHVVLVAHEKVNDSKKGDGRIYPHIGGMTLINKTMAEMDIVAHIERQIVGEEEEQQERFIGRMQPWENVVAKDGTNALGHARIADLTRWIDVANEALAHNTPADPADESDLPWSDPDEAVDRIKDELDATEEPVQPELGAA